MSDDEFFTAAFLARLHVTTGPSAVAAARAEAEQALEEFKLAQRGLRRPPIQRDADISYVRP